jgi:two-component sensor histidine kinase
MDNKIKKDMKILQRQIGAIDLDSEYMENESSLEDIENVKFLLSNTSESIVLLDTYGKLISYNDKFRDHLKLSGSILEGKNFFDLFPAEVSEFRQDQINEVIQTGKSLKFDEDFEGQNFKARIYPFLNNDGKVIKISYHLYNETKHKQRENSILQKIEDTEIMLKEVHHRVKNNMQLIASLISLQTAYVEDKTSLDAFKSTLNRIKSMAIVHEKLYKSETLAKIDFHSYVKTLTSNLLATYRHTKQNISVEVEIADIHLNINTAIPCGLILNELITNCLKYAFIGRNHGEIKVSMILISGNVYRLIIQDNGVGLPLGIDINNTDSLGLKLVHTLTDQLHGEFSVETQNGTKFIINFQDLY